MRAVDVVERAYGSSSADEFLLLDLRDRDACARAVAGGFDEVYQLAADMGGMQFISFAEAEIMRNNALINLNMVDAAVGSRKRRSTGRRTAAICRKVAESTDGVIDVFGGGETRRTFVYVDDLVSAVLLLTRSNEGRPTNIGPDESVTIRELVEAVAEVAGKNITIRPVEGPLGVAARNFSHDRIASLGWRPKYSLRDGIAQTYPWIGEQVFASASA